LGYYALVVKIVDAIGTLFEPLTRAVYPYLSQKYSVTKALFYRRNLQLTLLIFCIMVLMAIMTCLYAEEILWLISGDEPLDMLIYMLQVLSISLVFYMYGAQFTNMLVILNESRLLNRIVISTGISNVLIAPFAIYLFGVIGLIWVDVIVVMAIALVKGYFVYYKLRYKYKQ
jgi:PST family polysaccharide transporter